MKRIISVIIVLSMLFYSLCFVVSANNDEYLGKISIGYNNEIKYDMYKHGIYTYYIDNGEAVVYRCDMNYNYTAKIPEKLGGCPVTSIDSDAFSKAWTDISSMFAVFIPETIEEIGYGVFNDLLVNYIVMPDSVTYIPYDDVQEITTVYYAPNFSLRTHHYGPFDDDFEPLPTTVILSSSSDVYKKYANFNDIFVEYYKNHDHDAEHHVYDYTDPMKRLEFVLTDVLDNYRDVSKNAWYAPYAAYSVSKNIMVGSGNSFSPNKVTTRAEFITALYNYACVNAEVHNYFEIRPEYSSDIKDLYVGKASFSDVKPGMWYSDACAWAKENGISNGTANGLFSPDKPITSEEAVTLVANYIEKKNLLPEVRKNEYLRSGYKDSFKVADSVSGWADDAYSILTNRGIVQGNGNGMLEPKKTISRAESATLISVMAMLTAKQHRI